MESVPELPRLVQLQVIQEPRSEALNSSITPIQHRYLAELDRNWLIKSEGPLVDQSLEARKIGVTEGMCAERSVLIIRRGRKKKEIW